MLYLAYLNKGALLNWIQSEDATLISYMFILSAILAIFPVIPFTLFAGIMGVKYGLLVGGLINWFGSITAAILYFILTRYAFANYFRVYISKYKGLSKFTRMIEKNSFLAVFFARVVPIVPTPVINMYSAISMMAFYTFLVATMIGQIPGMFLYAFIGDQIFSSLRNLFLGLGFYISFILLVLLIYLVWFKEKKKVIID
jgi:uncharacterized membrane protein YdjX (TVP38/TMEM64 family)